MTSAAEPTQDSESGATSGPLAKHRCGETTYWLLGTAHVSRASAQDVQHLLRNHHFDAVAVELCNSRYQALQNPESWRKLDMFEVFRKGKAGMMAASLMLGAYQRRIAAQFDIVPGAEMRAAIDGARAADLPLHLIDRELGVTMKRVYRGVSWWQKLEIIGGLMFSFLDDNEIEEADVERLKHGDLLESTFSEFAAQSPQLYQVLIAERDRFMASRLRLSAAQSEPTQENVLVVVGAGHLEGLVQQLRQDRTDDAEQITKLEHIPAKRAWTRSLPWLIVAVILLGFGLGFRRSPDLGWAMVTDWVVINGGLSALGAALAMGHPLTILAAFLAAPLTSLNPMIGAGMVTGAVETWIRKPRVADFEALHDAIFTWRGWWKNRVARILLVFFLSTLGSAIGTYVAGFKIFDKLT